MSEVTDKGKRKIITAGAKNQPAGNVRFSPTRLRKMIGKLMYSLEHDTTSSKTSVSELLKLLQIYNEMTADRVKEVEVRWVDRLHPDEEPGK